MSATLGQPRKAVAEHASATTLLLYERYGQRVLTFCLSRLRDREEAQDAAQTTFVYVLRALERGVVPRHELAWLLKIAENVCHSSRRSLGRRMAVTSSADVTELEAAADSFSAESSEQVRDLREALELLPENQRRAVLLREWQGLSYAEIADELQLSVPAVEALLFRARRALAAHLERTRARLLNLGSSLVALRSLVQGGPAKMAVATAVAGIAAAPAIVDGHREAPSAKNRRASARSAFVSAPRQAARVPRPAGSARGQVGGKPDSAPAAAKSRSAREAAARAVAPTGAPTVAEASAPPPGLTPEAPAPAPAAPAPAPSPAPVPPDVQPVPPDVQPVIEPVVEPVTSPVPTVVAVVEPVVGAVKVSAPPAIPIR